MTKRVLLGGLALLTAAALPAFAGKNGGGSMIVHTNDAYNYSASSVCTAPESEPGDCESAITTASRAEGQVIWLLAAFHPDAQPGVTVIYFGVDYPGDVLEPVAFKFCGPSGSIEVPDPDWPLTGRGNSVAFGSPVTEHLFPFYVFRLNGGTTGSFFSTVKNPTSGYASFVDDSNPPVEDFVEDHFGTVRWGEAGATVCPTPPQAGACCMADSANCEMYLTDLDCTGRFGTWLGYGTTCGPFLCGPCCYWRNEGGGSYTRKCRVTSEFDCLNNEAQDDSVLVGGEFIYPAFNQPGVTCADVVDQAGEAWWCADPRDTEDPYNATVPVSWGRIKAIFR